MAPALEARPHHRPGRPRPRGVSGSLPFSVTSLPQVSRHRSLSGS